jgi:hypothetical protein
MSFTTFTDSTTAYANELMDNFYHIGQGDRLPMSGTALTLAGTQSALDIGSSAASWKNLYANNLYVTMSLTTSDRSMWTLVANAVAVTTATSISITGLNGDEFTNYMAEVKCVASITNALFINYILVNINNSFGSAANTSTNVQFAHDTSAINVNITNELRLYNQLISATGTNTSYVTLYGKIIAHGRKQDGFTPTMAISGGINYSYIDGVYYDYCVDGTDTTITSFHFLSLVGGDSVFNPGSAVRLWGRK